MMTWVFVFGLFLCFVAIRSANVVAFDFPDMTYGLDARTVMGQMNQMNQVDRKNPALVSEAFQAELIKSIYLRSLFSDNASLLNEDDKEFMPSTIESEYVREMMIDILSKQLASQDILQLNEPKRIGGALSD